jgi:hypothetical protein
MAKASKLTKVQIAALDKQRKDIDDTFASIAGILNKNRDLNRLAKKKLTSVINFLNKASNTLASMTEDDDEEGDEEGADE